MRITNTAAVEQVIEVAIADGYVDDNRLVGFIDLNGALQTMPVAAVSHITHPVQNISVATEVLPQKAERRSALVQCSGEVFIDSAVDGVKVTTFQWEAQDALVIVPVAEAVEVRILEELNE